MKQNRRNFLRAAAAATTPLLGGCAALDDIASEAADDRETTRSADLAFSTTQESGADRTTLERLSFPDPEVLELVNAEGKPVEADNPSSDTFTFTVQNTGHAGNLAIALFWQTSESGVEPRTVASLGTEGYRKERTNELYFDAGERRTVEFGATPPDGAVGYHFLTQPATYGANVRNAGSDGRITVTMNYVDPLLGTSTSDEDTVYVEAGATKTVLFDTIIKPRTEWEIQASSV